VPKNNRAQHYRQCCRLINQFHSKAIIISFSLGTAGSYKLDTEQLFKTGIGIKVIKIINMEVIQFFMVSVRDHLPIIIVLHIICH